MIILLINYCFNNFFFFFLRRIETNKNLMYLSDFIHWNYIGQKADPE